MEVTQIILIAFIVLLIVLYPIMTYSRNKKENLRMQEQTNSLKIGDKVLTTNGIYGTIVGIRDEFERKLVTIETGDENNKGYVSVDAYAIYKIFEDENAVSAESNQANENLEDTKQEEHVHAESPLENNDSKSGIENEEVEEKASEDNENLETTDSNEDGSDDAPKSEE